MAFWSQNDVEPKRNFRFKVEITGLAANSVLWWAKTVTTPSFECYVTLRIACSPVVTDS